MTDEIESVERRVDMRDYNEQPAPPDGGGDEGDGGDTPSEPAE